ncbi:MAG: stage 0 sporulation family protein [Oscillospiraceae bacterium]|nr:stage 0 sporulation family protein [Oscillospiraceae bacterium]
MIEIVGVRFQNSGKVYYFAPGGLTLPMGTRVVVETARGMEWGTVSIPNRKIESEGVVSPLKPVIRILTAEDERALEQNRQKEKKAFAVCEKKIAERKLDMKLVDVSCAFDNSKLLFYFTADTRVDFRELVKDLASVFRMRIELRQIGVRDEAKMFGGLGVCGREFCCRGYLSDFQPVSIKMAKEQGLSLNPTKISGTCGRLMCCLKHEQSVYEELSKITPRIGSYVKTPQGRGKVEDANLITGKLRIKPEGEDAVPYIIDRAEAEPIRQENKPRPQKEEHRRHDRKPGQNDQNARSAQGGQNHQKRAGNGQNAQKNQQTLAKTTKNEQSN